MEPTYLLYSVDNVYHFRDLEYQEGSLIQVASNLEMLIPFLKKKLKHGEEPISILPEKLGFNSGPELGETGKARLLNYEELDNLKKILNTS